MRQWLIALLIFITAVSYATDYSPIPVSQSIGKQPKAKVPFDIHDLKAKWRKRIETIKANGILPIIDIESSFNPSRVNAAEYARAMDRNGIALTAFSPQIGKKKYKQGVIWHDGAQRAVEVDPARYIPTSTAGIYPAFTQDPEAFVDTTIARVQADNYPLMGEFEFRHYMSPRQYKRGERYRDVSVPLDSSAGIKLFEFSERSGISFQIHYEIEDELLPVLEKMLAKFPDARVIWCHLAQVRFASRAKRYGPQYVRSLINKHKNIYFDLAFGDADSVYPGSHEKQARVWDSKDKVRQDWVTVIVDYPYRFVAALDIGGDRLEHVSEKSNSLRTFLSNLPKETQQVVAYKAAWKLLFNEDI